MIRGAGFANYGAGQLVCRFGTEMVRGTLLSSSRVLCPTPVALSSHTLLVALSLNNGTAGTFTSTSLSFTFYTEPTVTSISPTTGSAEGGETVVITGEGFSRLSTSSAQRSFYLRVRLGGYSAAELTATSHTDNTIVATTKWGKDEGGGQPVFVSLNGGLSFNTVSTARFTFKGLNPPTLVDAYFTLEATKIVVKFDSQPTNRGNTNGEVACNLLLSAATCSLLKGSGSEEARYDGCSSRPSFLKCKTIEGSEPLAAGAFSPMISQSRFVCRPLPQPAPE